MGATRVISWHHELLDLPKFSMVVIDDVGDRTQLSTGGSLPFLLFSCSTKLKLPLSFEFGSAPFEGASLLLKVAARFRNSGTLGRLLDLPDPLSQQAFLRSTVLRHLFGLGPSPRGLSLARLNALTLLLRPL